MQRWLLAGAACALTGCASDAHYACPVPEGNGGCHSVAEVYRETLDVHGPTTSSDRGPDTVTPAPRTSQVRGDGAIERIYAAAATPTSRAREATPGAALLTTPHVLRIFVTPWQDDEGDLEAGGFVYLRLDQGQWTISR